MPDLVFTIKTPAELAGAEEAAQQLEVNIGKAKALGKSTDELESKLAAATASIKSYKENLAQSGTATDSVYSKSEKHVFVAQQLSAGQADLSKTTQELTANIGEGTKAEIQAEITKSKLKEISKGLHGQFPLLSQAVKAFTNPLSIMIGVGAAAVAMFIELRRRAVEMARDVDFTPLAETTRIAGQAAGIAADDYAKYVKQLGAAKSAADEIKQQTDDLTQSLQDQAAAADEVATAQTELARARLEADRASGQITEEEFQKRSINLAAASQRDQSERAKKLRADQLAATRSQFDAGTATRENLLAAQPGAFKRTSDAQSEANLKKDQLEQVNKEIAALDEKKKQTGSLRPDEFATRNTLTQMRSRLELDVPELEARAKATAEAETKLAQTIEQLNQALEGLKNKISSMEARNKVQDETADATTSLRTKAAEIRANNISTQNERRMSEEANDKYREVRSPAGNQFKSTGAGPNVSAIIDAGDKAAGSATDAGQAFVAALEKISEANRATAARVSDSYNG